MAKTFTETVDSLYTHTLTNRRKKLVDQIFDATPFYEQLKAKGGITRWQGGRHLEFPVTKGVNPTSAWLDEDGTVSLQDFDPDMLIRYDWAYYAINITRKWVNDQRNSGKAALSSMINSKIDVTKNTTIDDYEEFLFGAQAGLSPYGLKDMAYNTGAGGVSDNTYPSGYSRATYTWWGSHYKASSTPAAVNLLPDTTNLFYTISQGRRMWEPTMMVTDQASFELYQAAIEQKFRIVNQHKTGDTKFPNIEFLGVPMFFSPKCTTGYNYLLNLNHLDLIIDPKYDFTPTPWKESINQPHTRAMQWTTTLQFVTDRSKSQGVLTGIAV